MKSFNNLYEYPLRTPGFVERCIKDTLRHKKATRKVRWARTHQEELKQSAIQYFYHYYTKPHRIKKIQDGVTHKEREIMVPADLTEQVVHHMVIETLKDAGFFRCLYTDSYGSIPGKGPHYGRRIIRGYIRYCNRTSPGKIKYYLKTDISKYFPSIPHSTLKQKLGKRIRDQKFFQLLSDIIDVTGTDRGLPIGFYTSQWLANWYLNEFDHFVAEQLRVRYFRYMDDMVFFHSNKRALFSLKDYLEQKLSLGYGLMLKGNWKVCRFSYDDKGYPLDFMGFKFYRNRTTLRKSTLRNMVRRAKNYYRHSEVLQQHQSVMYIKSYLKYSDVYRFAIKNIYPHINLQSVRNIISKLTRKANQNRRHICQHGINHSQISSLQSMTTSPLRYTYI